MSKLIFPDHGGVLVPNQTKVVKTHKLKTGKGTYTIKVVKYPSPFRSFGYHYLSPENEVTGGNSEMAHDEEDALDRAVQSIKEHEKRERKARLEAKKTPAQKAAARRAKRVAFFEQHAGFSYAPGQTPDEGRHETAVKLADAEVYAEAMRWSVDWKYDDEPYEMGDAETEAPSEVLIAILRDENGNVLETLSGIGDPDDNYKRVVEAELALEASKR